MFLVLLLNVVDVENGSILKIIDTVIWELLASTEEDNIYDDHRSGRTIPVSNSMAWMNWMNRFMYKKTSAKSIAKYT